MTELYHNPDGEVYCLLEGPDEEAIRLDCFIAATATRICGDWMSALRT